MSAAADGQDANCQARALEAENQAGPNQERARKFGEKSVWAQPGTLAFT